MTYCDEGLLQAHLDAELTAAEQRELDNHLQLCQSCRQRLSELTEINQLTRGKLTVALPDNQLNQAWHQLNQQAANKQKRVGFFFLLQTHRSALTVAAMLMFVLATALVAPVRNALAGFLHIFRVNQFQAVTFTVEDLQQIQSQFYAQGVRDIDLKQFGQLKLAGGENQFFSRDEAATLASQASFPFKMPMVPENFTLENAQLTMPLTIELFPSVKELNQLIKTLGGTQFLPQELTGQSFTISSQGSVSLFYSLQQAENTQMWQQLSVTITDTPEILVPAGIDVAVLREAVLSLPFIPQNIRNQLLEIENWQDTLPLPVGPESLTKEVFINGNRGLYIYETLGAEGFQQGHLVWSDGQRIYMLNSSMPKEELLAIASTL